MAVEAPAIGVPPVIDTLALGFGVELRDAGFDLALGLGTGSGISWAGGRGFCDGASTDGDPPRLACGGGGGVGLVPM
jgi:hypothetical protein